MAQKASKEAAERRFRIDLYTRALCEQHQTSLQTLIRNYSERQLDSILARLFQTQDPCLPDVECVRMLIKAGARPLQPLTHSNGGNNALAVAVASGKHQLVELLLTSPNLDKELMSKCSLIYYEDRAPVCSDTLVRYSVRNNDVDILQMLLSNGFLPDADPDSQPDQWESDSALMLACDRGDMTMVKLLVFYGARVNHRVISDDPLQEFDTSVSLAISGGHAEILHLLFRNGGSLETEYFSQLLFIEAVKKGYFDVVKLLANKGVDMSCALLQKASPLVNSLLVGHMGMAEYLVQMGASVTGEDSDSIPLLDVICKANLPKYYFYLRLGKWLMDHGANINQLNGEDRPPLMNVMDYYDIWMEPPVPECILMELGVDVDVRDNDGCTPLGPVLRLYTDVSRGHGSMTHVCSRFIFLIRCGVNINEPTQLICQHLDMYNLMLELPLVLALRSGLLLFAKMIWVAGSVRGQTATWKKIPWNQARLCIHLTRDDSIKEEGLTFLTEIVQEPRSLLDAARAVIRAQLGARSDKKILQLKLPSSVARFLMLPELDEMLNNL